MEMQASLPKPDFVILGYRGDSGMVRFYATRDVRKAAFSAEYHSASGAVWHLAADLRNLLISQASSWPEAFDIAAAQFAKAADDGDQPPSQEVWVKMMLPQEG